MLDKQKEVEVLVVTQNTKVKKLCRDKSTHHALKLNAIEQSQYQLTVEVVKLTCNARQIATPHYK